MKIEKPGRSITSTSIIPPIKIVILIFQRDLGLLRNPAQTLLVLPVQVNQATTAMTVLLFLRSKHERELLSHVPSVQLYAHEAIHSNTILEYFIKPSCAKFASAS